MQNAKNLLWPWKGELRAGEGGSPPYWQHWGSSKTITPADLPLYLRTETSASSGCPALSMLSALLRGFSWIWELS